MRAKVQYSFIHSRKTLFPSGYFVPEIRHCGWEGEKSKTFRANPFLLMGNKEHWSPTRFLCADYSPLHFPQSNKPKTNMVWHFCISFPFTLPSGPRTSSRRPSRTTTSWSTWRSRRSRRLWTACIQWSTARTAASSRRVTWAPWSTSWKVSQTVTFRGWDVGFCWRDSNYMKQIKSSPGGEAGTFSPR